ncbi:uncharacterized protein LOC119163180 isoform X1 [Rhipicephalus microplus]|uniref:uncharacterized protein LOC119163180 isoform X1 n=1 Tax=Rhipicephalus microplus TaxID=6941 RepID=UPI003F6A6A8A
MNAVKHEGEGDIEVWHITEADFMEAIGFDGCTSNGKIKVEFKKCAGTAVNRPTGAAVNAGSNVIERAATSEDVVSAILKFLKNPDETDRRTMKHSQASPATSGCKHSKKAARLQCHLCPFTAARKAGMVLHLNKHKRSDETDGRTTKHSQASPATSGCKRSKKTARLQCHLCPFSAAGKAGMALHLKKHERMASLSQAITSQSCDRSENRMSNRDSKSVSSVQGNHTTTEPLSTKELLVLRCYACPFVTSHQESLFDHIKSHTENKDELLACKFCTFTTRDKERMATHVETHTDEKPLKSTKGKPASADGGNFDARAWAHRVEALFKCSHCPHVFSEEALLRRHLLVSHNH